MFNQTNYINNFFEVLLNPVGVSSSVISNNYSYRECFAKILNPLLSEKDVLIWLLTKCKSKNILNVLKVLDKYKYSNIIFLKSKIQFKFNYEKFFKF